MADRVFVDTSVLLAAHDLDAGERRAIAEHVLRHLWEDRLGVLSTQVLQEFYVGLTGAPSSPVPRRAARDLVQAYAAWRMVTLDAADLISATDLEERHRLAFRDATIVAAARKAGAALLIADRIQPFRPISGLAVTNPFA
jgi:predicted nucleic acid-binding protein